MKKIKTPLIIIFIITLLVVVKIVYLSPEKETQTQPQKGGGKAKITNVSIYVANKETLENNFFCTGTILPNEEITLFSETAGKIVSIKFTEGAPVNKGDLLVKINDAELQAQLKKLKSQLNLLTDKETRQKKLFAINAISKEEYELSVNELFVKQSEIEMTVAQIAKTEIRAPFSGTIGLKNVSEGAYVNPSTSIASIHQLDPIKIEFALPEQYVSKLKKGSSIYFLVDGLTEKVEAKVYAYEPNIDPSTRTLKVRAICANSQKNILPGAFAKIELALNEKEKSILVPTESLIPILKGYKLFVCKNGLAKEINVVTGLRTEDRVQIISGLKEGDSVVVTGIMQLKNDNILKIISDK